MTPSDDPDAKRQLEGEGLDGWQDIATAPKDGRVIWVSQEDVGAFPMAWNPTGTNEMFAPGEIGIWELPDRSMTWREGEDGPTRWMSLRTRLIGSNSDD